MTSPTTRIAALILLCATVASAQITVSENEKSITIVTPQLEGIVQKQGYVSGIRGGSFLDRKTGFRDQGFGLDIVDWIMEPGSDETYRDRLDKELIYEFNNPWHGRIPKRSIEGPQICTQAGRLEPQVTRGKDFVAIRQSFRYRTAAPGRKTGSVWEQTIVFPEGRRYFISSDTITSVNASDAMFLRIDMPGHIRHDKGDTFSQIYLSYVGTLPSSRFIADFPPDEKFIYQRSAAKPPQQFIRAYRIRDPKTGADGPWLAGMTLDPQAVYEAWCHQRGYVCMIEEIGGRRIRPGESFGAAFIVGFFDSIDDMHRTYDEHAGHNRLIVTDTAWRLGK